MGNTGHKHRRPRSGGKSSSERTWNRSVAKLEEELRLTDIAWLAWHSEKRRGKTTEPFDPAWLNLVETVEIAEDEAGENPLDSAQSIG